MERAPIHSALRSGFKIVPRRLRAPLIRASNWAIWSFKSLRWRLPLAKLRLISLTQKVLSSVGRYHCPVCDRRVRRFHPLPSMYMEEFSRYGYKYTPDDAETCNARRYTCPLCTATDRDRLYALYLLDYFRDLPSSDTIKFVEFAPTAQLSGFIKNLIAKSERRFSYRTADLFLEGVDDQVDIMDMNIYADNSVDFFVCSHVLEHVTDDKKALGELYRVLKPGGAGILVVPIALPAEEIDEDPTETDEAERWRRFGQFDHFRQYSKNGFVSRVSEAGFEVRQLGVDHFGADTFRKNGIAERSVVYIVQKA